MYDVCASVSPSRKEHVDLKLSSDVVYEDPDLGFQMTVSPVYHDQANGKDSPVYDEPARMLQVPTDAKHKRISREFSQDQLALVIDLLQKIIPGHYGSVPMDISTQSSPAPVRIDTLPSEIESLYDDIISTPPSEKSHLYTNFEEGRLATFHQDRSHLVKPTPPPKPLPMKRKKVPMKPGPSSRLGVELHSTGHGGPGSVTPSDEDRRQTISKYKHNIPLPL